MSEPPPHAVPSLGREPPRKRRSQRWTDTGAVLLVCASVAAVIATAMPSLLRAAGLGIPEATGRRDADHLRLPTSPPGAPGNPIVAPDEDEDEGESDDPRLTQIERDFAEGLLPGHRTAEERARDAETFGAPPGGAKLKAARAGGPLRLFKDPLPGASVVAIVARGTPIQVVREVGDWALIKYRGGGEPITGWVQKSEISVR